MTEFIERSVELDSSVVPGKVLIMYGPRRAGKTTLLKSYLASCGLRYRLETGDDVRIRHLLGSGDLKQIVAFAEGFDLVAIDEAQQIPGIGMGLKILLDRLPDLRIIATGSSTFDLAGAVGEPLTGRKRTLTLFPISQMELKQKFNLLDSRNDVGALWENFVVAERLKKRSYTGIYGTFHFWRTYDGQEIDYVEERDGGLFGFECKWSSKQRDTPPKKWRESYPGATFELVTPDNYLDFAG